MKITSAIIKSNFNKLNESIHQYITDGKANQEFLNRLIKLDKEGLFKSYQEAWVVIFHKFYKANMAYLYRNRVQYYIGSFIRFLNELTLSEQIKQINYVAHCTKFNDSMYGVIHNILLNKAYSKVYSKDVKPLCDSVIKSFIREYDIETVIELESKINPNDFKEVLVQRFDSDFHKVKLSVWRKPIFKEILSYTRKMMIFNEALKKTLDPIGCAEDLGIDVELLKPELTKELLKETNLSIIRSNFNSKIHNQEMVIAHIADIIKKKQNPDPKDLARDFLNKRGYYPYWGMFG